MFKGVISLVFLASFAIAVAGNQACNVCAVNAGTSSSSCNTCNLSCNPCGDCKSAPTCYGHPYLAYRSQSVNAAREIAGWEEYINRYDMDCTYGAFYMAFEYQKSFRSERITQFLFGQDAIDCCRLLIQGSEIENRHPRAWCADYFGLPQDFNSAVSFCPKIENFIVDVNFFLGLDELAEGLYFRVHAPIVHTRWDLCMNERIFNEGTAAFPESYMGKEEIPRNLLPRNFTQAVCGNVVWGDMTEPLQYGRMSSCTLTKTRLSDIHFAFGWNFFLDEDYHCGINLRAAAPTGNRPNGCYLFEPMIGNGKHWELGLGVTGSYIFWRDECHEDRSFGAYIDANITHLFRTCQCRSFDFCNRPNSRYMLLEEMQTNDSDIGGAKGDITPSCNTIEDVTKANYQYKGNLVHANKFSTLNIDVRIDVQADIAVKLAYVRDNWTFDLGYNLWARTGEKFCTDDDCCSCGCPTDRIFAIKGDSSIYGQTGSGDPSCNEITEPVALSAAQKCADIHGGFNYSMPNDNNLDPLQNPNVDNARWAAIADDDDSCPLFTLTDIETTCQNIKTSINPTLEKQKDLNLCKSPSAITHKVFGHAGYAWKDKDEDYIPFIGVGLEAEFDSLKKCKDCCGKTRFGVSQLGVWLKGGVSFE